MQLRKLKMEDAPLMLEWMHDPDCVENLQANFASKTLEDCQRFVDYAQNPGEDLHLAIVDENDTYMGTVSLKHIHDGRAEFAIAIRACAMGKGFSAWGMRAIIDKGLQEMGLDEVYWCVSPVNKRAVRFYDKNGYTRVQNIAAPGYTPEQIEAYIWYAEGR